MFTKEEFFAGWISGMLAVLSTHPLETLKVRQQIYNKSIRHTFQVTWHLEGVRGFYRGLIFPMSVYGISNSIFFGVYHNVFKYIEEQNPLIYVNNYKLWVLHVWEASVVAGFAQVTFVNPFEVMKTQMQGRTGNQRGKYSNTNVKSLEVIANIFKTSGVRGFYVGYLPLVLRDVPTYGIYMWSFMELNTLLENHKIGKNTAHVLAGGVAGVLSWIFVLPLDTIKSLMQTQDPRQPKYSSMYDCFKKTYAAGGVKFLFRGSLMTVLRTFPLNSVTFSVYYYIMDNINKMKK